MEKDKQIKESEQMMIEGDKRYAARQSWLESSKRREPAKEGECPKNVNFHNRLLSIEEIKGLIDKVRIQMRREERWANRAASLNSPIYQPSLDTYSFRHTF